MKKSVNYNQSEILNDIKELHCNGSFDADITYGNGSFYKETERPKFCSDKEKLFDHVIKAESSKLPVIDSSFNSVVFDPPFLTYIKQGREHNSIMGKRFSGYWRYDELEEHYKLTLKEVNRVLRKKGVMVFKCQDIIHNHKMHCTHINVVNWASKYGFRLKDLFILPAKNRIPVKSNGKKKAVQKHARIYHSYFIVLEKIANHALGKEEV